MLIAETTATAHSQAVNNFIYPPLGPAFESSARPFSELIRLDRAPRHTRPFVIYTSTPYCRVRCHSCHCFRGVLPRGKQKEALLDEYLTCVIQQAEAFSAARRFRERECGAIYFGGGTASLMTAHQVGELVRTLRSRFQLSANCEITLEGNPTDFSSDYLREVRPFITRVSIGYQSANPATLRALNSPHDSATGLAAVRNALQADVRTVNVDLLFNVPGQSLQQWQEDVRTLVDLSPHGISPGDYIVHPGSPADVLMRTGRLGQQAPTGAVYAWYKAAAIELERRGYVEQLRGIFTRERHRYEYGRLSCTNASEIIGLGAGAYSFVHRYQFQTEGNAEQFKRRVRSGDMIHAALLSERATDRHLMERFVVLSLFSSAVSGDAFRNRFGIELLEVFSGEVAELLKVGLANMDGGDLRLTEAGREHRRYVYARFRSADHR